MNVCFHLMKTVKSCADFKFIRVISENRKKKQMNASCNSYGFTAAEKTENMLIT